MHNIYYSENIKFELYIQAIMALAKMLFPIIVIGCE